ncbi:MAG: isoprenylcysteine carboxylmethyltransferase family protein [bacterium]|nr:isoprenylcysteine carboxylmethyltransferase family protein [bacterium]
METTEGPGGVGEQHVATAKRPHRTARARVVGLLYLAVLVGLPFGSAGRVDWVEGWVFLALIIAGGIGSKLFVKRRNPEVLEHRRGIGAGTKRWDLFWLAGFRLMLISIVVVAGLDAVRFGWTEMPGWLCPLGVALTSFGFALAARSMAENPHFEPTVRIQTDRDHRVIDSGPYAIVRHPGYVGVAVITLGFPLVLRSNWALIAALVAVLTLGLRTWLEDRMLQAELAGYAEYAGRVRSRLIPRVW